MIQKSKLPVGRVPNSRLAYKKSELLEMLPFSKNTFEGMIAKGLFPNGIKAHPSAHRVWLKNDIETWLREKKEEVK